MSLETAFNYQKDYLVVKICFDLFGVLFTSLYYMLAKRYFKFDFILGIDCVFEYKVDY